MASVADAVAAVARLCGDRLEPARGVVRASGDGAVLALSWEGALTAPLHRDRALRTLDRAGWTAAPDLDAPAVAEAPPGAESVEVDATWESLARIAREGCATALGLVGLHAGGAFAVVESAQPAEACAKGLRGPGLRVIAPGPLRDAVPGWESMGASGAWQRLAAALGTEAA
jgi:hypothetical protein